MAGGSGVAIDDIWQSVALEERLELISKCQASGFLAATANLMVVGSIAYGFDQIWLLAAAVASSFFVFPLFSSFTWRSGKPSLILAYLAVRTMARRYGYSFDLPNLDIILIFKGEYKELFDTKEQEELYKQKQKVDFDNISELSRKVWVVLMRGGVLVMSERRGGAKLEFISTISHESTIKNTEENIDPSERACIIEGVAQSKGRKILLKSRHKGAHYVFEKQFGTLIEECLKTQESIEKLRQKGQG
ncbi:MAG TPA: hypothetical protein PKA63_13345 [Oligoflexia bacterium]|nr:hypothetical protein [Oligoflexia bacterium]HMP49646.1 hypothetical protein [Oligoflexia bacterium]